jgi:hypothetical protein
MIKKTIFFHIGHAKCGSSTIQHFCEENRDALLADGVFYPPTSGLVFHGEISPTFWKVAGNPTDVSGNIEKFKKIINSSSATRIVLSCEGFHQDDLQLFEQFSEYDLRFIYYVRRQADYFESILNQRIKEGAISYELPTFVVDFHGIVSKFAHRFGNDRIKVRVLDPRFLAGGNLINDFLQLIGCSNREKFSTTGHKNVSLTGKYLRYAAHITLIPLTELERRDIARELESLSGEHPEDRLELLSRTQRSIIANDNKVKNLRLIGENFGEYDQTSIEEYFLDKVAGARASAISDASRSIAVCEKLKMSKADQLDVFSRLSPVATSLILLRYTGPVAYDEGHKISYPVFGRLARSSEEFALGVLRRDLEIAKYKVNAMEEKLLQQTDPYLLEVYAGYNIVYCKRMIFAVPECLAVNWDHPAEVHSNPNIIVDHDIGRVKAVIDSSRKRTWFSWKR